MSMAWIRKHYGVPAKRGVRVRYSGDIGGVSHDGVIVASRYPYIRVRMPTFHGGKISTLHPTWKVEYLADEKGGDGR